MKHDAGAGQDDPTGVETFTFDGNQLNVGVVGQIGSAQVVKFANLGPNRTERHFEIESGSGSV